MPPPSRLLRSPALASALEYAQLGLPVVPLRDESKVPRIRAWQDRASCDPRTLREWFRRWPRANVGIRTGDGRVVMDIDAKADGEKSLKKLVGRRKIPATATTFTGGGGRQLWLAVPEPIGCSQGFLGLPGIDVRGRGGQAVVEPSIHPETGREYVWTRHPRSGIAECPGWLLRLLTSGPPAPAPAAPPRRSGLTPTRRSGNAEALAADLIERFPVEGYGHRNNQMVGAVASLVGRGYDDLTTTEAVERWWRHFHELGRVRTAPAGARREIGRTLAVIRGSDRFVPSIGTGGHREACRSIGLTAAGRAMLAWEPARLAPAPRADPRGEYKPNTKRVTMNSERLCVSDDEEAFVEALIVHAAHKRRVEPGGLIRMTWDQAREIVADRHPDFRWDNTQFDRLARKYVWRPRRPATRCELLVQIDKGYRQRGERVGAPSTYEMTGLRTFLDADPPAVCG